MKRLLLIVAFSLLSSWAVAQEGVQVVDSLESVMAKQEGREKVLTMIELSKAFFDFSFDDCVDWSEKALRHRGGGASQCEKRFPAFTSAGTDVWAAF